MGYVPILVNNHMNALLLFLAPIIFFISMGLLCMFNYEKSGNVYRKHICMCLYFQYDTFFYKHNDFKFFWILKS